VWSAEFIALVTMSLVAGIAAPPTIGFSWAKAVETKSRLRAVLA
jgi:hypothetical protein